MHNDRLVVHSEMSNARSPLFSHFGAAIGGLTSIRAYNAENVFIAEAMQRIDKYSRPAVTYYNLNRFVHYTRFPGHRQWSEPLI